MSALAPTLQTFFTDYMQRQRQASPHTIAAYRDAVRLLLTFTAQHTGKQPHQLDIVDLDAPADRRVPRSHRARPAQHDPHPQRQARGDPFALPLRRRCATPSTPR